MFRNFQDSITQTDCYKETIESLDDNQNIISVLREAVITTEYPLGTTDKTVECLKRKNDFDSDGSSAPKNAVIYRILVLLEGKILKNCIENRNCMESIFNSF